MIAGLRLIRHMARIQRVTLTPKDCRKVAFVFERYSGSWVGLFRGSVSDLSKLKAIIRGLAKRGIVGQDTSQPSSEGPDRAAQPGAPAA